MIPSDAVANQAASEGIVTGGSDNQAQLMNPDCTSSSQNDPTTSMIIDRNDTRLHTPPSGADFGSSSQLGEKHDKIKNSLLETIEPYIPSSDLTQTERTSEADSVPFSTVARGRHSRGRGGRNQHQRRNQSIHFPSLNEENKTFKRFFVMKDQNGEQLWPKLDIIRANDELTKTLKGDPKKITELKDGSILIETQNSEQSTRIQQIQKLNNISVKVEQHKFLNQTKGTIHSPRFVKMETETLKNELTVEDLRKSKSGRPKSVR